MNWVQRAGKVRGVVEAAKLRDQLRDRLADPDGGDAQELGDALDVIEGRFPDLEDMPGPASTVSEEMAARRGRGGSGYQGIKRPKQPKSRPRAPKAESGPPKRSRGPQSPKPKGGRKRGSGSGKALAAGYLMGRRGGGRNRSQKYIEQTGLPSVGRSATQLTMQALGVVVGLSLVYVLLRNSQTAGKGQSAVELVSSAVAGAVATFINPVDPLGAKTKGKGGVDPASLPSGDPGGSALLTAALRGKRRANSKKGIHGYAPANHDRTSAPVRPRSATPRSPKKPTNSGRAVSPSILPQLHH